MNLEIGVQSMSTQWLQFLLLYGQNSAFVHVHTAHKTYAPAGTTLGEGA